MPRTKEEVAAELVWRYVEYIREETDARRDAAFSRDELEQLLRALETASRVPEALGGEPSESILAAARAHLHAALAAAPPEAAGRAAPAAPAAPAVAPWQRLRAWALPAAAAAVLVLSAALASVPLWHHVRTIVRRVPVPYSGP